MEDKMLFSEVYSAYYNTVAKLLRLAADGELDLKRMRSEIRKNAYAESALTIEPALTSKRWQLMDESLATPIEHGAHRPFTLLERRFLKTIALDERMRLFEDEVHLADLEELRDVKPLFFPDDVVLFDKYLDGDPYCDENYRNVFGTVRRAIHGGLSLDVYYRGRKAMRNISCRPLCLEYSEKDDKFRVYVRTSRGEMYLNMARIARALASGSFKELAPQALDISDRLKTGCELELVDERNALERALLHFGHLQKEVQRLDDTHYRISLCYEKNDETEMVIRVLSFGPMIKAVSPPDFVELIRNRLLEQKNQNQSGI